ncbi:hypothetical protein [Streptomyces sp. LN590]
MILSPVRGERVLVRPVIDVTDTRYVRGRIGLKVFGGRTAYQGTFVRAP